MHVKKHKLVGRLLYLLLQYKKAIIEHKIIMGVGLFYLVVFTGFIVSPEYLILALQAMLIINFLVTTCLAVFLSQRFAIKLSAGIRDIMLGFIILITFGFGFMTGVHPYLLGLFVICSIALLVFYIKTLPSKQRDIDIPNILPADKAVDIVLPKDSVFEKHEVFGDMRNCLLAKAFRLKEEADSIRLGIGIAETIKNYKHDIKVSIHIKDSLLREVLLFSKVFSPRKHYEERAWLDIDLDLDWKKTDFASHLFSIKVEDYNGNSKGLECYISEPRFKRGTHRPRKIIFAVFDALRHDHIGDMTPHINSFSKDAVVFKNAFVQGEWTLTSFMSYLTSLYPSVHGVYHPTKQQDLHPSVITLPQILREEGFVTKCFYTHKRLISSDGFSRGFDSRLIRHTDKENKVADCDDVLSYAVDTLDLHKKDDLFLMLHFFDAHQPCSPPSPYSGKFDKTYGKPEIKSVRIHLLKNKNSDFNSRDIENLTARYDAEIYRQDKRFGQLIDNMKSTGQYDDAMIILASDHGMLLNDHESLIAIKLFDQTLKVPLIVKFPNSQGAVNDAIVQANIDVMPTILDTFGIKGGASQGKSFTYNEFAISESLFNNCYTVSVRDTHYRYLVNTDSSEEELYRVFPDKPEEKLSGESVNKIIGKYRNKAKEHIKNMKLRGIK